METLGPTDESACQFFDDLCRRIGNISSDSREISFIYRRLSVTIQRFNAALLLRDIRFARRFGPLAIPYLFLDFLFLTPGIHTTRGKNIIIFYTPGSIDPRGYYYYYYY